MGKTARWFRGLLGGKKAAVSASDSKFSKEKKRWSFVRSFRDRDRSTDPPPPEAVVAGGDSQACHGEGSCVYGDGEPDHNKHAIAVAAATAAVAEAAVAAAQAAAAVVELTSGGRCAGAHVSWRRKEDWAAVKIQSAFRGYLARRALKALKGLVKIQALVRGHIVRKQAVETLRCMQALVRVQSLVRSQASGRANGSEIRRLNRSSHQPNLSRSPHQPHLGPATPEKSEHGIRPTGTKHARPTNLKRNTSRSSIMDAVDMQKDQNWLDHWMHEQSWDHYGTPRKAGAGDEWKSDKILEVDHGKPNFNSKRRNNNPPLSQSTFNSRSSATLPASPSKDSTATHLLVPTPSANEKHLPSPLISPDEVDDANFNTAENSPQFYSASSRAASSRRGPFTPKSECSRSFYSGYSDYPNYMANTESSKAKIRSQSAPKQRPEFERSSLTKRFPIHGSGDSRQVAGSRASMPGLSSLHAKFTSKAYPGSGRLDRLGMPIHEVVGHSGTNHNRY